MNTIPDDRLARLRYMVEHKGHSPETVARLAKQGIDAMQSPHGPMIAVSAIELRVLLSYYNPNPCKCIDCGGTEPGHSPDCTYMKELHGDSFEQKLHDGLQGNSDAEA